MTNILTIYSRKIYDIPPHQVMYLKTINSIKSNKLFGVNLVWGYNLVMNPVRNSGDQHCQCQIHLTI